MALSPLLSDCEAGILVHICISKEDLNDAKLSLVKFNLILKLFYTFKLDTAALRAYSRQLCCLSFTILTGITFFN